MSFGTQLRDARKRAGLTQAQLGAMLDVSDCTVTSWEKETRQPDIPAIKKLTQMLDISADELLETGYASVKHSGEGKTAMEIAQVTEPKTPQPRSELNAAARLGVFLTKAGYVQDEDSLTDKQLTTILSLLDLIFGGEDNN